MKKVLSLFMAAAMMISCFAMSTSVMAKDIPELKLETPLEITVPKETVDETSVKLAKFIPETSGWYEFECDKDYENTPSGIDKNAPGGCISVERITSDEQTTYGFAFIVDTDYFSDEDKEEYKKEGVDVEHFKHPLFSANLEAGQEYFLVGFQDGAEDYTANITVKHHTHTIKKNQVETVKVKKDGTSEADGGIYETCTEWSCPYLKYTTEFPALDGASVKNAVYTGKAVKPAVTVKTTYGKKLSTKYYTVTYKNNKKIGKGKAVIKFRNGYTGTVTKTFKILPKKTAVKKAKSAKKAVKVSYKKVAGVTGYQVQVAVNKKFTKGKKTVTVKGAKKTSKVVKGLKSKKKYYVRVRTYKTVSGKKYYSSWSAVKNAKTK